MLARALPGVSAEYSHLSRSVLIEALGRALTALHALPATSCPYDETVSERLGRAFRSIEAGETDGAHFASRNRGVKPIELYHRLAANTPKEDLVVVHGDATLSNMIIDDAGTVGFIDCGHSGRADRYLDLAVIADDISNTFGDEWLMPFARAYGEQAWETPKARFYSDLYELF
jgi:aminoglycoside 3'-phosphotransferase-2